MKSGCHILSGSMKVYQQYVFPVELCRVTWAPRTDLDLLS